MASERALVDWRTWMYLKDQCTEELVQSMAGRNPKVDECTPEQHRAGVEGVDRFVILGLQWPLAGYHVPNDFVAEHVARYAGRAVGFACVHPDAHDALVEFERCVTKLGF